MNSETEVRKDCEQSCRIKQMSLLKRFVTSVVNLLCTMCSEFYCYLFNIVQLSKSNVAYLEETSLPGCYDEEISSITSDRSPPV